jgi:CHAT domain
LETSDERLRILVVRSEPKSPLIGTVSGASTFKTIASLAADGAEVIPLETPTQKEFEEAMTSDPSPHIVHFIGHGMPNKIALRKSDQELRAARLDLKKRKALRQSNGEEVDEAAWIDSRTVCTLLAGENPPRLVFLHACHGASAARSERTLRGLESVARDLAYTGRIGAVIAMQYAIQNTEADLFATTFYAKLREGLDVDDAVARARRELGTRPGRNAFDDRVFGTPVIYVGNAAPIVRAVSGGGESSKAMPKVGCPNPQCQSYVKRGDPECLVCEKPLMDCPKCATGVVCANIRSRCNAPRCDFVVVPAAPGAPSASAAFEPAAARGDDEDADLPPQSDTV